jgi:hypothetical protein
MYTASYLLTRDEDLHLDTALRLFAPRSLIFSNCDYSLRLACVSAYSLRVVGNMPERRSSVLGICPKISTVLATSQE